MHFSQRAGSLREVVAQVSNMCLELGHFVRKRIPKGFRLKAQGWRGTSLPWVIWPTIPSTPTGLWLPGLPGPFANMLLMLITTSLPQPRWVEILSDSLLVAQVSNL